MANTIQLRRSATANAVPTTTQLALGELAINTYDGKLYLKKDVGGTETIIEVTGGGGGSANIAVSETAPTSPTNGNLWWDSASGQLKIYYVGPINSYWVEASTNVTGTGSGGGTLQETILSVSANTTLTTSATFINATNTITLTLPTAGVTIGFRIYIRNAGVGQITLVGTINGMANITLGETNSVIGLVYTSSGWVIF
jgi:hypothetical protein